MAQAGPHSGQAEAEGQVRLQVGVQQSCQSSRDTAVMLHGRDRLEWTALHALLLDVFSAPNRTRRVSSNHDGKEDSGRFVSPIWGRFF